MILVRVLAKARFQVPQFDRSIATGTQYKGRPRDTQFQTRAVGRAFARGCSGGRRFRRIDPVQGRW